MEFANPTLTHDSGNIDMSMEERYLTFYIEGQIYGIEIQYVREIVDLQKITRVPGLAYYIKGLINLRGQVIPVLDVRLRFGLDSHEYTQRTCFIIVEVGITFIGLIVDQVSDVLLIHDNQIQDPPNTNDNDEVEYFVKGLGKVGENVQFLLDLSKLIAHPKYDPTHEEPQ